ncbi:TRAFAC clade GTPase domain-containing protein [Williamsia sp. MIQD14]|uniref:TRAFAC clade GTPase domain-containing protein n=1 Tax=Williamsia sp. MIQD14 TaxID=3425703 RepID=UPI003DA0C167
MAKFPRVREQHIAVFGESGSGKTVLVSSFFGPAQEGSYKNDLWDLVADEVGQGIRLYKNFLGMRDKATVPPATRFRATTYYFSVKLKGAEVDAAKKWPFDVLRLAWHDYPGEWFEAEPSSAGERDRRTECFRSLLRSDVAILLVDGQKLLDHHGEEELYLKSLMFNFRQTLSRLEDDLLEDGPIVEFPRIWILALSKADLLPDWDVDRFRDLVILNAAEDIERLRSTITGFIEAPEALSIGEDFMLLSSAKFERMAGSPRAIGINMSRRIGLDLILPVASILPLERRVQWQTKYDIPFRVLDTLADGAELLAAALADGKFTPVEKLLAKMPKGGKIAKAMLPILAEAVALAGPKLLEMNEKARARNDVLRTTMTQFKLDLERGVEDKVIRNSR